MVDLFRLIRNFLSSSNGCKLVENGHSFVISRKHLCFQRFLKQRKIFCSTERTFSPKQTKNAPKNSCTSDFFPKGIQRSEVQPSSHQTILVYPPIFIKGMQRSTVRISSHLLIIPFNKVTFLMHLLPWRQKVWLPHETNVLRICH